MTNLPNVQELIGTIRRGEVEKAQQLLSETPQLATDSDEDGWTPLMVACRLRDVSLVKTLLDLGAPVDARNRLNVQSREGSNFALWFAANQKQPNLVEVARMLVEHGAQVNMAGELGETPLHQAAVWNNADIAEYLLTVGASVDAETTAGKTPLHLALQHGFYGVAELLGRHGAKDDSENSTSTHRTGRIMPETQAIFYLLMPVTLRVCDSCWKTTPAWHMSGASPAMTKENCNAAS